MFPKRQRTENRTLLDKYHEMPCCVCGQTPSDPNHIKTRGSGGPDEVWNLLPKCRWHHTEWGQIGPQKFLKKYPVVELRLKLLGWKTFPKLWHPKA